MSSSVALDLGFHCFIDVPAFCVRVAKVLTRMEFKDSSKTFLFTYAAKYHALFNLLIMFIHYFSRFFSPEFKQVS